jgi:hypothetical protein
VADTDLATGRGPFDGPDRRGQTEIVGAGRRLRRLRRHSQCGRAGRPGRADAQVRHRDNATGLRLRRLGAHLRRVCRLDHRAVPVRRTGSARQPPHGLAVGRGLRDQRGVVAGGAERSLRLDTGVAPGGHGLRGHRSRPAAADRHTDPGGGCHLVQHRVAARMDRAGRRGEPRSRCGPCRCGEGVASQCCRFDGGTTRRIRSCGRRGCP